ncbi:AAR2 domain-containing protein [Pyrenochaeta sp. DS3sAY3a]|nr:AAR2 domain-containing protein [Pyrenochaeta sp. DS3sAY3a]
MIPISSLHDSPLSLNISPKILRQTWFEELFSPRMDPSSITNCVLLLNIPAKALAGIDLLSFTTSPRFRGIKDLPPGLHFVFAATSAAFSVRQGAWFYVTPGTGSPQVFVKRWDDESEDLVAETDQSEVLHWKANLGSLWKASLTPYRQTVEEGDSGEEETWSEESMAWSNLTSHITPTLLTRICGLNPDHWSLTTASAAKQDLESIPGLESSSNISQEKDLGLLPIDLTRTWREGATGKERTDAAQDRSWFLGDLIENHCQAENKRGREFEILGELQFVFLMVLTLNNNSCLEQWKRMLKLLLTCQQAVKERTVLFIELIRLLRVQLGQCPSAEGDMFGMNEARGGFLRPLLTNFRRHVDESAGTWKADLVEEMDELQEYLEKEFGWQLGYSYVRRGFVDLEDGERVEMDMDDADEDDEQGEYAPVVVDLTPAQLKALDQNNSNDGGHRSDSIGDSSESEDETELEDMDTRF